MAKDHIKGQANGGGGANKGIIWRFYVLLFVGLLVGYAKFLWPPVFGRMHNEGIAFIDAIRDITLHAIAFVALTLAWIFAALLVFLKGRLGG